MNENRTIKETSLKVILISLLFIASLFVFAFIADEIVLEKEGVFDSTVFHFFKEHTTPALIQFMEGITFFGSSNFLFPAYLVLIGVLLLKKKKRWAIDIFIVATSSTLLMYGFKEIFRRHRPDLPLIKTLNSYSFPSGHALTSFIFCSVLIYLIWHEKFQPAFKWIMTILLLFFSILIGLSRIVLRFHYPSDVLAGFCLGLSWVLLSLWIENKIHRKVQGSPSND